MAVFKGDSGDNFFNGTGGDDVFRLQDGGNDQAEGLGGNDRFVMGAALAPGDALNGGDGKDTVILHGDYSGGLTFGDDAISSIEHFRLTGDFNYDLIMNDFNVAAGTRMRIDGSAIGAGHSITIDASDESDGRYIMTGSASDDTLTGGGRNDVFILDRGGHDTVHGEGGNDYLVFGATLSGLDGVYGGGGDDTLDLAGNYSTTSTLNIHGVENIYLNSGVYNFVLQDSAFNHLGEQIEVETFHLGGPSDQLIFDASAVTRGSIDIGSSDNNDVLLGGAGNDFFDLDTNPGGEDAVHGGGGNDVVQVSTDLDAGDTLDGGDGFDELNIDGDYSAGVTFGNHTILNFETIYFPEDPANDLSYNFTTDDATVGTGQTLTINANGMGAATTLVWNGTAETNGLFAIVAGAGDDTLSGGKMGDRFDISIGGSDTIKYTDVDQSTSNNYDTIIGFNAGDGKFDLPATPSAFDGTFNVGAVSNDANFDTDMGGFISDEIHAHDAWIEHVTGGGLDGHDFVVVDLNGNGEYDGGTDYIIDVTGYSGTFTGANFI